jgi:hypothetical protein
MKKRRTLASALCALAGLSLPHSSPASDFTLVQDGQALVRIVYANEASEYPTPATVQTQRFQACVNDFRGIIQRISGADIPAGPAGEAGDAGFANTIQVGLTPAARAAGLDRRVAGLKPHALVIHCDPDKKVLYLLGSTLEGSGHALYEFLESLGCRWYMPGPFGEKLPAMNSIAVGALDTTREPGFELRAIQFGTDGSLSRPRTREEVMEWMRRNKFGGWGPDRGHKFASLVPEARYGKEHSEYYSLRDGKRRMSHLCMSNPKTLEAAEAFLTEYFTKNPKANGYPVALADGAQYCECPECTRACGGEAREIMPLYLSFTGELFDRIDRKFPGREFQYGFYVYSNLMRPPRGRIPKQLAPYIAPLGYDAFQAAADPQRYRSLSVAAAFPAETVARIQSGSLSESTRLVHDVIQAWCAGTKNVYFRDFDPTLTFAQNMPVVRTYQLAIDIPWHKELGVRGYTPQACANSWFSSGINFWVRSRLYWDTGLDIGTVMQDYCKGLFGAAWEPMYGLLDKLARRTLESPDSRHGDQVLTRLYTSQWVMELEPFLRQAEALAATEAEREHVAMWRLCQQHMLKYLLVREAELAGDFVNAARLGRDYLQFLDSISTVNPHFVDHRWDAKREYSMQTMVPQYEALAARLNGETGRLFLALPTHWWFRYDPDDLGVKEQWGRFDPLPDYVPPAGVEVKAAYPPLADWRVQATETSWQTLSNDYRGYNWYRTQVRIPQAVEGRPVRMLVTGIFGHMDFFINGEPVSWVARVSTKDTTNEVTVRHLDLGAAWSWNYNETLDIPVERYLRPGMTNTFAVRTRDKWHWGGIFKRVQFYEPVAEPPLPGQPAVRCDCSH